MAKINYRQMTLEDCEKMEEIDASQYIGKAWRDVDGIKKLVLIDYQDPSWPNGFDLHYENLYNTITNNGVAIGAFNEDDTLIGMATLNRMSYGENYKYALLDQLFVSLDERGKGIGKTLFLRCVEIARNFGADKIVISSGSAEETVAFYFAIGCVEAENREDTLYENDPRDFQLEYIIGEF